MFHGSMAKGRVDLIASKVINSFCVCAILLYIQMSHKWIILEMEKKLAVAMATNEELLQNVFP